MHFRASRRDALKLTAVSFAAALPLFAQAQTYPASPITVVVPYAAGGGVDIVTRIVAKGMDAAAHNTIIVDNKPGAGTNIGMSYVAKAKPDGYTLLTASNSLASNGALFSNLNFDPKSDFTPIGKIGSTALVIVAPANSPFNTMKDLIEYSKSHPTEISYGSPGNGSAGHIANELLKQTVGLQAQHIPYKGGAPAITDLIGGRISFLSVNPLEVLSHIQAGKLKAIGVFGSKPSAVLPQTPTLASLGYKDTDADIWWGLVGPKGIPQDVVNKLSNTLKQSVASADVNDQLKRLGAVPDYLDSDHFGSFINQQIAKWTPVIKQAGIQTD